MATASVQVRRVEAARRELKARLRGQSAGPLNRRMAKAALVGGRKAHKEERTMSKKSKISKGEVVVGVVGAMAVVMAIIIITHLFTLDVSAHYDAGGDGGSYVEYVPTPMPVSIEVIQIERVCVSTVEHPCGHRAGQEGDSVASVCGDPTCGMVDKPELCGGVSPCFYCCCGCSNGCNGHKPAPKQVEERWVDNCLIRNGKIIGCW